MRNSELIACELRLLLAIRQMVCLIEGRPNAARIDELFENQKS